MAAQQRQQHRRRRRRRVPRRRPRRKENKKTTETYVVLRVGGDRFSLWPERGVQRCDHIRPWLVSVQLLIALPRFIGITDALSGHLPHRMAHHRLPLESHRGPAAGSHWRCCLRYYYRWFSLRFRWHSRSFVLIFRRCSAIIGSFIDSIISQLFFLLLSLLTP